MDGHGYAAVELLRRLIRFDTVNPPGSERAAIEYLRELLVEAGFDCELLAAEPERPNLVARLRAAGAAAAAGPTLAYLGHVDTVLADAGEWTHDPWSAAIADGCMWGRGALDMKSQVAAEVAAAVSLAREGWRPARGELLVMAVVDEETGGELGAKWLCAEHPDRVRCDLLINEGGGPHFELDGRRYYPVCCAEKGVFRFTVSTSGAAGHASMPRLGKNALLALGPVLERFAARRPALVPTPAPLAFLAAIGAGAGDPAAALARMGELDARLLSMFEPMFTVTFAPTMASASEKINVIPSSAELRVDCRVPPGLGEPEVRAALDQVLGGIEGVALEFAPLPGESLSGTGDGVSSRPGESLSGTGDGVSSRPGESLSGTGDGVSSRPGESLPGTGGGISYPPAKRLSGTGDGLSSPPADGGAGGGDGALLIRFTETVVGNGSPADAPLMATLRDWVAEHDPGAEVVPTVMPGFTDSHHFRAAFPDCVAYGFFPQRHQSLLQTQALMHAPDERIDLRDLALAAECYRALPPRLLGTG